ncbi:MAG TPA: twin-arginine translocase subunit TatB [Deltaproteobacteria bacterium]|nr:twin-arginine translocase subunit TatB [Deltaproteobacteria bacterium]
MFGIGFSEIIIILVIALIVLGPDKLPDIAKVLGRTFGEFRKAVDELKKSVDVTGGIDAEKVKRDLSIDGPFLQTGAEASGTPAAKKAVRRRSRSAAAAKAAARGAATAADSRSGPAGDESAAVDRKDAAERPGTEKG